MKKVVAYFVIIGGAVIGASLSSCATRSSEDQWKRDHTRYQEQLKRYPDRESSEQEKADAEAARKAKIPTK